MAPDGPVSQIALNIRTERVTANNAYPEGGARITIRGGWPLDKLGEVIQESKFDGIFYAFPVPRIGLGRLGGEPARYDRDGHETPPR